MKLHISQVRATKLVNAFQNGSVIFPYVEVSVNNSTPFRSMKGTGQSPFWSEQMAFEVSSTEQRVMFEFWHDSVVNNVMQREHLGRASISARDLSSDPQGQREYALYDPRNNLLPGKVSIGASLSSVSPPIQAPRVQAPPVQAPPVQAPPNQAPQILRGPSGNWVFPTNLGPQQQTPRPQPMPQQAPRPQLQYAPRPQYRPPQHVAPPPRNGTYPGHHAPQRAPHLLQRPPHMPPPPLRPPQRQPAAPIYQRPSMVRPAFGPPSFAVAAAPGAARPQTLVTTASNLVKNQVQPGNIEQVFSIAKPVLQFTPLLKELVPALEYLAKAIDQVPANKEMFQRLQKTVNRMATSLKHCDMNKLEKPHLKDWIDNLMACINEALKLTHKFAQQYSAKSDWIQKGQNILSSQGDAKRIKEMQTMMEAEWNMLSTTLLLPV